MDQFFILSALPFDTKSISLVETYVFITQIKISIAFAYKDFFLNTFDYLLKTGHRIWEIICDLKSYTETPWNYFITGSRWYDLKVYFFPK